MRIRDRRRVLSEINVVPYIDVMLVLLVIFMITAPLLTQGVHVNLPQVKSKAIPVKKQIPVIVSIDKRGQLYANVSSTPAAPLTPQQLFNLVAAQLLIAKREHHPRPVFVKGDKQVDYGRNMQTIALLQKAGAPSVGLLTKNIHTA